MSGILEFQNFKTIKKVVRGLIFLSTVDKCLRLFLIQQDTMLGANANTVPWKLV